jgi:hypothetical protein
MLDNLESLPCKDRPRMLSQSTLGAPSLRKWRTARWLVVALIPVMASCVAASARNLPAVAPIFIALFGTGIAFSLFATIASGVESTNWGTYFRSRERVRFWIGVATNVIIYAAVSIAGWALNADQFAATHSIEPSVPKSGDARTIETP